MEYKKTLVREKEEGSRLVGRWHVTQPYKTKKLLARERGGLSTGRRVARHTALYFKKKTLVRETEEGSRLVGRWHVTQTYFETVGVPAHQIHTCV
jgi:hypothetical protein